MDNDKNINRNSEKNRNPASRSQNEINPDTRTREPSRNPDSENDRKGRNVDVELENKGNEVEGRELQTSPKNKAEDIAEGLKNREKKQSQNKE